MHPEPNGFGDPVATVRHYRRDVPSAELLAALIDQSEDMVTILNPDLSWRWSSAGALRMMGDLDHDDPAQLVFNRLHPDDQALAGHIFNTVLAEGGTQSERFECRVLGGDGTWHAIESLVSVLIDDPKVRGIVVQSRDVTIRRQVLDDLARSYDRLHTLVANLHTGILVEDDERRLMVVNQTFCDLFALVTPPESMLGGTLDSLGVRARDLVLDPGAVERRTTEILSERSLVVGNRVVLTSGRVLERDFLPLVVDDSYYGHVWLFRDVTAEAMAEEERRLLAEQQRTDIARLEALDEEKSELLATISHEIRTPLTSIVGFAELLEAELSEPAQAQLRGRVQVILRNARQLRRLSSDLVELDRLEAGSAEFAVEEVAIDRLLREALAALGPLAAEHGVTLASGVVPGTRLRVDPVRISQVVDNLLSNAIKFTPRGGVVELRGRPTECAWVVEVVDTGIGIPDEELGSLFTRFFRGSAARSGDTPGRGLGLAISKAIVEMHGGTISVASTPGDGTTVTVVLSGSTRGSD